MKKIIYAVPGIAAVASFAETGSSAPDWATAANVTNATSGLVTWGGLIIAGIGGVHCCSRWPSPLGEGCQPRCW